MTELGAQYYRPPFPNDRYWEDDMRRMADWGLHTVQLWVLWGWVEPAPGQFNFDDYDRLVDAAGRHGLHIVVSTIAAIHPYWIHREAPGSEMITAAGHKVISSNRRECHYGMTPGGCFDHPDVWERMRHFITTVAERYKPVGYLTGWDVWNELRWNVHAGDQVCYCPHTIRRFREWLDQKYGGLEGLNAAWQRRYPTWDDVMPGHAPRSPYTEKMAFQRFINWRSTQHALDRYRVVKAIDPGRPVTVHGNAPTPLIASNHESFPLHRGNDWDMAETIDGIGTSSFPLWGRMDNYDYFTRLDCTASAAGDKEVWLSEVQGGRSATGFVLQKPVHAHLQQTWIWGGIARRAQKIIFWCWRDEVFGCESSGFGLCGNDGCAQERAEAMRTTRAVLDQHGELLEQFAPDPARAGVLFNPDSYYLHWSENGDETPARDALMGYCRALSRLNIPYRIIEADHLDCLDGLRILFLPRATTLSDETIEQLSSFARGGGTIVCESECGAFDAAGVYRYPEDRWLVKLTGCTEVGRRDLEKSKLRVKIDGEKLKIPAAQWATPMRGDIVDTMAEHADGGLVVTAQAGDGKAIMIGTYLGDSYYETRDPDFETFIASLCREAGAAPVAEALDNNAGGVHVDAGTAGGRRMLFVFAEKPDKSILLRIKGNALQCPVIDLISGKEIDTDDGATLIIPEPEWGVTVLAETSG